MWNKACDELRRHQDFLSRVKNSPDFLKEPYGNPFDSEELKAQFHAATLGGASNDDDADFDDDKSNFDDQESEEVILRTTTILNKIHKSIYCL